MQGLSDLESKWGTGLFKIDYDVQDISLDQYSAWGINIGAGGSI